MKDALVVGFSDNEGAILDLELGEAERLGFKDGGLLGF